MSINSEEMEKGFVQANKLILDYLNDGKTTGVKARVALSFVSNCTKLKATENNAKQMQLGCLVQIADNKEQLKEYIKLTQPDIIPTKVLKSGK